jgi:hypothetical protein
LRNTGRQQDPEGCRSPAVRTHQHPTRRAACGSAYDQMGPGAGNQYVDAHGQITRTQAAGLSVDHDRSKCTLSCR